MKYAIFLMLAAFSVVAYAQPIYRCGGDHGHIALQDRPCTERRDARNVAQAHDETSSRRIFQKISGDRRITQYATNQRRCQNAMRIAALCGKFAGMFSCDEKGFRHEESTPVGALKPAAINHGSAFKMEQCALQATTGGS